MPFRSTAVLVALPALLAGVLVAAPSADAAGYDAFVKTKNVSISSSGTGKVAVACHAGSTCKGKIWFTDDGGSPVKRSFSVGGGKTSYVKVAMHSGVAINPHNAAPVAGRDYKSVPDVRLTVQESSPKHTTHRYTVTTETPVTRQQIRGNVTGPGGVSDLKVELVKTIRGGNTQVVKTDRVSGGAYSMNVSLGTNNSPGSPYRLRVSGKDQDGTFRSWFYRGGDAEPTGGGAYLRDSSVVRATKYNAFDANFTYASISGTTAAGAEVTVASPPPSFSGGTATLRELDIERCANIFGQTTASGSGAYDVTFLPATSSTNNRYMLAVRNDSTEAWYGSGSERFGSCHDATRYSHSRAELITLTGSIGGKTLPAGSSGNSITIDSDHSSSFTPTVQGDRWISVRERIPGLKILQTPIVREGPASSAGERTFNNLPPGDYYVEVGRRTGCSDWYSSRFPNNRAYFKGEDRASERWKSFTRLSALPGNASSGYERIARTVEPNPATTAEQDHVKSGYAGWMYRPYCKANGAGTINNLDVVDTGNVRTKETSRDPKGATVHGHVSRTGGRTNKEMLVRLSSSAGTRVIRTAITDGGGNFTVSGLPSGSWTVSVNSDSWRGISRTFTGRHSITTKVGQSYGIGTLRFRG